MNFIIEPLADRVLVKFSEKKGKTAGGILIPETAQEDQMTGEVLAVGRTAYWGAATGLLRGELSREEAVEEIAAGYERLITLWEGD